jgi:hypothetical protein
MIRNPFTHFTDMELQRIHHAIMHMVFVKELDDPTRLDLLEWALKEMNDRADSE